MADEENLDRLAEQAAEDAVKEEEEEAAASSQAAASEEPNKSTPPAAAAPAITPKPFVPHTEMPPMKGPKKVEYCPEDGMPPDFCEYGGKWEQSKPWVLANYPEFYPELAGLSLDDIKKNAADKKAEEAKKQAEKQLPGGKSKKTSEPKLIVKVARRQGKKMTTTIIGLEHYGVKLDDAAKKFKKKFACGSAACKGGPGQPDSVEIQGDPGREELTALLKKEFPDVPYKTIDWQDAS